VAMHVDDAKLDVSLGEQPPRDGQQSGEVVLDHDHYTSQPALHQAAQDELPVLEVFAAEAGEAREHSLLAVSAQADDQVDAARSQPIPVAHFHVLAVEEKRQQISLERPSVPQIELLHQAGGHRVEILLRRAQSHLLESNLGGVYRTAGGEKAQQQGLRLFGVASIVAVRQKGRTELAAPGAWHADVDRDGTQREGAIVTAIALVPDHTCQVGSALGQAQIAQHEPEQLTQAEVTEPRGEHVVDLGLRGLRHGLRWYSLPWICCHLFAPRQSTGDTDPPTPGPKPWGQFVSGPSPPDPLSRRRSSLEAACGRCRSRGRRAPEPSSE